MKRYVAIIIAIITSLELLFRVFGLGSFPLYSKSNLIGYYFKENQQGNFLNSKKWYINNYGMVAEYSYTNDNEEKIILIGDSIVYGGNNISHENRIGVILQSLINKPVYSIAAGSWGFENELLYLNQLNLNLNNKKIIFILNSGDFGEKSHWACEKNHPTNYPFMLSYYYFDKYVIDQECKSYINKITNEKIEWQIYLKELLSKKSPSNIIILLYPNLAEYNDKYDFIKEKNELMKVDKNLKIYNFNEYSGIVKEIYRDTIHPNAYGNKLIAQYLRSLIND